MRRSTPYILGISGGFFHGNQDGAAALLHGSQYLSAVEEERLLRVKHARGCFPEKAIEFCLKKNQLSIYDIDFLAFHTDSYTGIETSIREYMNSAFGHCPEIRLVNHHKAHASCAFLSSGFNEAMVLTFDLSGDGISTTLNHGKDGQVECLETFKKPNSLGAFYAIMTQYLGFEMDADEYKVMGLAAYGSENSETLSKVEKILRVNDEGYVFDASFYRSGLTRQQPNYSHRLIDLLGPVRLKHQAISQREKDIAWAVQHQFEKACIRLLQKLRQKVGSQNLCLGGGCALNSVMAGKLLREEGVRSVYISPASGDAGAALGAALFIGTSLGFQYGRLPTPFLGPSFSNEEIGEKIRLAKMEAQFLEDEQLLEAVSNDIANGKICGWFQGALELGARALGNRSILANAQDPKAKDRLNQFVKFREGFRPFAPAVVEEDAHQYFEDIHPAPYMTFTFKTKTDCLPATTHVDQTSRVLTVRKEENPLFYRLLKKIGEKTGHSVALNTSLNVMGQPMVACPRGALGVFGTTGMDTIAIGNWLIRKT